MRSIWLASYPRSGNTLCRLILHRMCGVKTQSIYDGEESWFQELGFVGPDHNAIVKTHISGDVMKGVEMVTSGPHESIVVVRDGLETIASQYAFGDATFEPPYTPADMIIGKHDYGTWSDFYKYWLPRADVVVRYEDMIDDPFAVACELAEWLGVEAVDAELPTQDEVNTHVRHCTFSGPKWPKILHGYEDLFWDVNGSMMERLGYGDRYAARSEEQAASQAS